MVGVTGAVFQRPRPRTPPRPGPSIPPASRRDFLHNRGVPAHRKPPGTHQGHRSHVPVAVLPAPASPEPPEPPAGLLISTRQAWAGFWASPLAGLVVDSDLPALRRLFELYDERARSWRGYRRRRLVEGSQGQPVLSPLFRAAMALEAEIRPLEDRFGVTPAARLKLGIRLGEAARSLEDLVRDLDEDEEERRSRVLGEHYQPPPKDPGGAG
jgi:hypothetical protein